MLWLSSPRCPAGIEKANASAAGKHYFSLAYNVFLYIKLKSKPNIVFLARITYSENFGDFRWIGPLKHTQIPII